MAIKMLTAEEGEVLSGVGGSVRLLLEGESMGAWVQTVPPGSGPPMHFHVDEDEAAFMVSGEFEWTIDGVSRRMGPGGFVFIPKGVEHRFVNVGEGDASCVGWVTPGGFEAYFRERVHLDPLRDGEALSAAAKGFGMNVVA